MFEKAAMRICIVGVLLFCSGAAPKAPELIPLPDKEYEGLTAEDVQAICKELSEPGRRGETGAAVFAARFGERGIPLLIDLLGTKLVGNQRCTVCLRLGVLGGEKAIESIIGVIQAELPAVFGSRERKDLFFAIVSLGFSDSDAARAFLKKLMTEEYWLSRPDLPQAGESRLDLAENRYSLRRAALQTYSDSLLIFKGRLVTDPEYFGDIPEDLHERVPAVLEQSEISRRMRTEEIPRRVQEILKESP